MNRLFDPFEQLDTSSSRDFGGTGLGLAICDRLINLMSGDIKVTSTLGKGSQFTISIPCSFKSSNDSDDHTPSVAVYTPLKQQSATILVAEDNDINAMIVCDMLKKLGHTVIVVSNGKIALAAALKRNFDLILMDIQMPEMDGMESTMAIRNAGVKTPIVGLSANVLEQDKLKAVQAGMNDYLHKPIIFETLAESVNQWVVSKVEC
jgi:CheY-like chemotaxis protein